MDKKRGPRVGQQTNEFRVVDAAAGIIEKAPTEATGAKDGASEGKCPKCGHGEHVRANAHLGGICIGCECDYRAPEPEKAAPAAISGPAEVVKKLAAWIEHSRAAGSLNVAIPVYMAEYILGTMIGVSQDPDFAGLAEAVSLPPIELEPQKKLDVWSDWPGILAATLLAVIETNSHPKAIEDGKFNLEAFDRIIASSARRGLVYRGRLERTGAEGELECFNCGKERTWFSVPLCIDCYKELHDTK